MKTTHAVWERENIGVNAYEIALDASDTPEMLAEEESKTFVLCFQMTPR